MSDFGVAVVRGWVTNCVVLMVALVCAPIFGQTPGPLPGGPAPRPGLPTDGLGEAAPRTSYQPGPQEYNTRETLQSSVDGTVWYQN